MGSFLTCATVVAAPWVIAPPLAAQVLAPTQWINGSASSEDHLGNSVPISGVSVIIGGYYGSTFVFVRSAGVWSLQDELFSLAPGSPYQRSVWISGDTTEWSSSVP